MFNPFFHPLRHSLLNYVPMVGGVQFPLLSLEHYGSPFAGDETYHDYAIQEVDLNFAVIYGTFFSSNWENARSYTRKTFLNSTTVRATAGGSVTTYSLIPHFCVIEFDHRLIKSMQNITPTFLASSGLQRETINTIDPAKTQVASAHFYIECDIFNVRRHNVRFTFEDSTTLKMDRGGATLEDALYMSIFILEFE